jgi:hypothetical protein
MAATRYTINAGTTSATATIPDGVAPFNLAVIDWISGGMTASTQAAVIVSIDGATLAASVIHRTCASSAAGLTAPFAIDFAGGFPVWSIIDADAVAETTVIVTVTGGGTATAANIAVGYHYENPAQRRAINMTQHG